MSTEHPIHAWPIAEQWPASQPSGNSGQLAAPSEREAFEAWFHGPDAADNTQSYVFLPKYIPDIRRLVADVTWRSWQARAALSTPPAAAPAISSADADYWVASRAGIIAALERAGFKLMSNRDGFWLQATPAAADDWQSCAPAAEAKLAMLKPVTEHWRKLATAAQPTPCAGKNCGTTTAQHGPECIAEHAAAVAGGRVVKVPEHMALVPRDPTDAMREAGHRGWMKATCDVLEADPGPEKDGPRSNIAAAYRAMVAAALQRDGNG